MKHYTRTIMLRRHLRTAALALLTLPLTACGGSSSSSAPATMNLGVTDGPVASASAVVISFTGVELQPSGGGSSVTINFNSPQTINLLNEQNGSEASLLSGASVPAGNYDWIRLLLNVSSNGTVANSYIEINGAQYPLVIPSGAQTGLKLVQGFTMTANQVANFTVDFMLQQSITAPPGLTSGGGTQDYILKPALRLINNVQAGTISGTVALSTLQSNSACLAGYSGSGPLPNAQVDIFSGTVTPSSSLTPVVEPEIALSSSGSYGYDQPFLLAGAYTVAVACSSTSSAGTSTVTFIPAAGTAATVTANQTTTVNF
ncbi:MAG: DUF4382 domain-containing protein [Pseudomonadota bacterium]|jgi:hypothetical protein|nr:DUF4382 domain-containing protein [Pseudomonadota bacterium]